jgi:hypothetical protein
MVGMEIKNIREDYIFPIHLKQVDILEGIPVYSSETLKKKFIELLSNSLKDSELLEKISNLVSQAKLVPCFVTKSMLRMLVSKIGIARKNIGFTGTYYREKDKVFVIIDMAKYKMFTPSNEELIKITMHELVHMSFYKNWKKLVSLFIDELSKFYISFYKCYFEIDIDEVEMRKVVKKMFWEDFENEEHIHLHFAEHSKLNKERTKKYWEFVDELYNRGWKDSLYKKYEDIIDCLDSAYNKVYHILLGENPSPGQELWKPHEVICVASEFRKTDPNIKKAILMI